MNEFWIQCITFCTRLCDDLIASDSGGWRLPLDFNTARRSFDRYRIVLIDKLVNKLLLLLKQQLLEKFVDGLYVFVRGFVRFIVVTRIISGVRFGFSIHSQWLGLYNDSLGEFSRNNGITSLSRGFERVLELLGKSWLITQGAEDLLKDSGALQEEDAVQFLIESTLNS